MLKIISLKNLRKKYGYLFYKLSSNKSKNK